MGFKLNEKIKISISVLALLLFSIFLAAMMFILINLLNLLKFILRSAIDNGMSQEFQLIFICVLLYLTIQAASLIISCGFDIVKSMPEKKDMMEDKRK